MNVKFSFQKIVFCKIHFFDLFSYFSSFLFEVCINLFEVLHIVNIESRNSQKFAFEKRRYYHDSNILSFKFFKLSSFELFEVHFYLNYSNLIFIWIIRYSSSLELFEVYLHLNYSNLRFHLNYSTFKVLFQFPTLRFSSQLFDNCVRFNV